MSAGSPGKSRLSDYGILGYGFDAINWVPRARVADFTFDQADHRYPWRGADISFPDQIVVSPAPTGRLVDGNHSGRIATARQYQRNLTASVEVSVTDPETDLTYSGEADAVNKLFDQATSVTAFALYEAEYDYVFFQLSSVQIESCVSPDVAEAARSCGDDPDRINLFFDTFGTHCVTRADVGGQMCVRTLVRLNSETSKKVSELKVDIAAQARAENEDYVRGGLGFDERDMRTDSIYREVSKKEVSLIGGDVTAPSYDSWRESLKDSDVPTQQMALGARCGLALRSAGISSDRETQNLGLINMKFSPLVEILRRAGVIDSDAARVWNAALEQYLSGRNPFDDTPQRLAPDMDDSSVIRERERATHSMRGWMATYETYVGLEALPGSRAQVRCNSDFEPGGWTTAIVYAGETLTLRGKTPYLSSEMYIEFVKAFDDDGGRLFTENRLVSWLD
jgi:hypothetical protein